MNFSSHNVRLRDGSTTMSEDVPLVADYADAPLRTLRLALGSDLKGKSIVDLGCLEGGYSVEFARAGMIAVGVEARQTNIDKCNHVYKNVGLVNLSFIKDDVMNIDNYGMFDASFCYGLLYHLDEPRLFMRKLSSITRRIIIINTHVALEGIHNNTHNLSEMTENEGLRGRWYGEHLATTIEEKESYILSSWGNQRSFWPTRAGLIRMVEENGFDIVFEQFDWMRNFGEAIETGRYMQEQRTQIVGIRSKAPNSK